jgi:threonine dehydratase
VPVLVTVPHVEPSPLELAPWDASILLKREDAHELGAFKWRGALATLERWRTDVVTASTGNHGAATAWAANRLGLEASVFVPEAASATKLGILERLGARVVQTGSDLDEAKEAARLYAEDRGLPLFEDGAEPAQLDGYGAIADEILEQLGDAPEAVVVPVGNGALLAGIGRTLGRRAPETLRIGVAAKEAPVMVESWQAGRPVESGSSATIADGLAVRVAIPYAVEQLAEHSDELLVVSERELAESVRDYWANGIRAEPAAAAALAALPQLALEGTIVLIVTGRNIDDELLQRCIEDPGSFPD